MDNGIPASLNIIKAIKEQPDPDKVHFAYLGTVAMTGGRLEPVHFGRVGDPMFPSKHDYYALSKVFSEEEIGIVVSNILSVVQHDLGEFQAARTSNESIPNDDLSHVWCADTCDPRLRDSWSADNPSVGQDAVTGWRCVNTLLKMSRSRDINC